MCTENLSPVITGMWSHKMPETQCFAPWVSCLETNRVQSKPQTMESNAVQTWISEHKTYSWLGIQTEWGTSTILHVNWTNKIILPEGKFWDLKIAKLSPETEENYGPIKRLGRNWGDVLYFFFSFCLKIHLLLALIAQKSGHLERAWFINIGRIFCIGSCCTSFSVTPRISFLAMSPMTAEGKILEVDRCGDQLQWATRERLLMEEWGLSEIQDSECAFSAGTGMASCDKTCTGELQMAKLGKTFAKMTMKPLKKWSMVAKIKV